MLIPVLRLVAGAVFGYIVSSTSCEESQNVKEMRAELQDLRTQVSNISEQASAGATAAYEEAKPLASSKGFQAPRLEANEWDCLWCIAMMVADYWVTHNGDLKVAAMLAYQYLSDPDKTVEY